MTQDEKDILLKDLCTRLPYGVKISDNEGDVVNVVGIHKDAILIPYAGIIKAIQIDGCKPYLFPFSSMTEEQKTEEYKLMNSNSYTSTVELPDFYNKSHIDYRGLIPMGLANDATGLNIY